MSVSDMFSDFIGNLAISNLNTISQRYGEITSALNKQFRDTESKTANTLQVGSFGRKTGINGISDLDMLYIMPKTKWDNYNRSGGQLKLLQVQIFTSSDGQAHLEVALDQETVWLNQSQMSALFDTSTDSISLHLKNIYSEEELSEPATTEDFSVVRQEGRRQVRRRIKHYNLDAIISVGYRIKSQRGVQFRQWATQVLKDHLVQGYTLNQRRLAERGIEFEQAVNLLSRTLTNQGMVSTEGEAVARVISDYARSWSLLQGYDKQHLTEIGIKQPDMLPLALDEALRAISELKQTLIAKGEATELFGQIRGDGLASALATIEQGFGDELFYPNVASRAAHLLYFVIKNHPLADGNKRTGSFLFLWYLQRNQHLLAKPVEQLINDNTLVALALLVAESLPDQKTLMIRLIEHFILLKESTEDKD